MKKKLILLSILCFTFLGMSVVSHNQIKAASYTDADWDTLTNLLQAGDTITVDSSYTTVTANFIDFDGNVVNTQSTNTITIPSYANTNAKFKGWRKGNKYIDSASHTITLNFSPYFKPSLYTTPVKTGEPVRFYIDINEFPTNSANWSFDWVTGGPGGGVAIEGSGKGTELIIQPDSKYYKNGFIIAVGTRGAGGAILTEEATVQLLPADPVVEDATSKGVQTGDHSSTTLFIFLLSASFVSLLALKVKKVK